MKLEMMLRTCQSNICGDITMGKFGDVQLTQKILLSLSLVEETRQSECGVQGNKSSHLTPLK
jgi:hypothetical protein